MDKDNNLEPGSTEEKESKIENVKYIGIVLIFLGALSKLLSVVNLQFKGMDIFGQYKSYVELGCIVIGLLLFIVAKIIDKSKND